MPSEPYMTAEQFRAARRRLGLSFRELARMLGVTVNQAKRLAADESYSSHRPVMETTGRLIEAYLAGYRPPDWPRPHQD